MDDDQEFRGNQSSCCCCFSFIITAGLSPLFLWLSLRANKPKCSIQYFYIPALNKTLNSQHNVTLNFMIRFDNPNKDQGVYYDDVHLSFFTNNNISSLLLLGNYTVPRFYQGREKKAKRWGHVEPVNNQMVLRAVLANGSAIFRANLKTEVRFKIAMWKTKRYGVELGADVEINGEGEKVQKKGIKMKKSESPQRLLSYDNCFFICVLMNLVVFLLYF